MGVLRLSAHHLTFNLCSHHIQPVFVFARQTRLYSERENFSLEGTRTFLQTQTGQHQGRRRSTWSLGFHDDEHSYDASYDRRSGRSTTNTDRSIALPVGPGGRQKEKSWLFSQSAITKEEKRRKEEKEEEEKGGEKRGGRGEKRGYKGQKRR